MNLSYLNSYLKVDIGVEVEKLGAYVEAMIEVEIILFGVIQDSRLSLAIHEQRPAMRVIQFSDGKDEYQLLSANEQDSSSINMATLLGKS